MKVITVIAKIVAKNDYLDQVKKSLEELIIPTRFEEGCINYDFFSSIQDPKINFFF